MFAIILAHGKVKKTINGKLEAKSLEDAAEVIRKDGLSSELKDLTNIDNAEKDIINSVNDTKAVTGEADAINNLGKDINDMDDGFVGSKTNTMDTIAKDSKEGPKLKNESLAEEGKNVAKASDDIGIISKDAAEMKNFKNDIKDVAKNEGNITSIKNEANEAGQAMKDENIAKDIMMDAKSAEKATSSIVEILKSDMNNLFDHVLETVKQGTKIIFTMAENGKKVAIEIADLIKNKISDAAIDFCITGCFIGDTLVLSKEGYVKIEDIKMGDYVYSQDVRTGEKAFKEVLQVQKRNTSEIVRVKVQDEEIQVTQSHLFYTNGQWELAGNLKAGDILISANGEEKKVISVENYLAKELEAIYNFSVEEYHTYFVGRFGILVHNEGCTPKEIAKAKAGENLKTGLDDYYNALKNGDIEIINLDNGKVYKSNKIAAAIDINNPKVDNMNIGFNGGMGKYNPSVDADFVVNLPEDIAKLNKKVRGDYTIKEYSKNALKTLYDNECIDNLFKKMLIIINQKE